MNRNLPNCQRLWDYVDWDENSSFHKRNFTKYNFNRGRSPSVQRNRKRSRSYSVDSRRNHYMRNFSDNDIGNYSYCEGNERYSPFQDEFYGEAYQKKSSHKLNANAVIKKMIALLREKKKSESNRSNKTKFRKREPLPPFTGTTSIGEESIVEGFFCKFCNVYLMDKEQTDKHLLTKSHFRKYVKHLNQIKEENEDEEIETIKDSLTDNISC